MPFMPARPHLAHSTLKPHGSQCRRTKNARGDTLKRVANMLRTTNRNDRALCVKRCQTRSRAQHNAHSERTPLRGDNPKCDNTLSRRPIPRPPSRSPATHSPRQPCPLPVRGSEYCGQPLRQVFVWISSRRQIRPLVVKTRIRIESTANLCLDFTYARDPHTIPNPCNSKGATPKKLPRRELRGVCERMMGPQRRERLIGELQRRGCIGSLATPMAEKCGVGQTKRRGGGRTRG